MPTTIAAFAALTVLLHVALLLGLRHVLRRRTRPAARPAVPARHDRVGWQVYLNDLPNPCDDGHTRLYVTGASAESSGVICSVCTAELARPAWMDCDRCHWFPIDGHLHVAHCGTHADDPQHQDPQHQDPQQEAA